MKNNYPQCDELSCLPDNHPGQPCPPTRTAEAIAAAIEKPCCQGHDPVYNAKRNASEWPWLDNPYTCKTPMGAGVLGAKTLHPNNKYVAEAKAMCSETARAMAQEKKYLEEAQTIRSETAKAMKREKLAKTDWMGKWADAVLDHAEENKRWAKRLEDMQLHFEQRILEVQEEYNQMTEEGYEEAYQIICEQRKIQEALQEELDKVRNPQMAETMGRQLDSLEIQED